ncbi:MAG TPA: selenocysteine-specific translation elongation factor [Streptosporangiaceae bacterium]|nr:selenocysteine-specific translation elongation factor [Streptosporangiaceae bacterium]
MQVIATAGHVDHGKSTLVRTLTGMEPDRWEEERRRGLTIDLGFAWMALPDGGKLAFVDVPGHERFVPNMLAGLGPVPAVLVVVAADEGWMPQSAEHLAAIDALGISRGLLAVTRADLADPGPALRRASDEIAATSLGKVDAIAVSGVTGMGLPELRGALARLASTLPTPDPAAPVRLWVDRAFSIKGSGTVVTGTLPAGTVRTGDELLLTPSMRPVRVRGIESLHESAERVSGVARVALNLRGVSRDVPARGMALVQPGGWAMTNVIDVRLGKVPAVRRTPKAQRGRALPRTLTVHIGSARTPAQIRVLGAQPRDDAGGPGSGTIARLTLRDRLPLHVGDRVLLRDPGSAEPMIMGAVVLDVMAPPLGRREAAAAAAAELASWPEVPAAADLLRRHGLLHAAVLAASGARGDPGLAIGEWAADPAYWARAGQRLAGMVAEHVARDPLAPGMPVNAARAALGLPDRRLAEALARTPAGQPGAAPVSLDGGYLRPAPPRPAGGQGPAGAGDSGGTGGAGHAVPPGGGAVRSGPAGARRAGAVPGGVSGPRLPQPPGASPRGDAAPAPMASPAGAPPLPGPVMTAVRAVLEDLAAAPFRAPEAGRLRELGLDNRAIAAAARVGLLLRVGDQIVLAPGADAEAARLLARLPQPFTTAEARQALGTTRRVVIPLLEFLDRARVTERLPDDRRRLRPGRGHRQDGAG